MIDKTEFGARIAALRAQKGVSARDMSLSIGQSAGYINNIENGINYPSMAAFLYICDYFGITPREFFDAETEAPIQTQALLQAVKGLHPSQLEHLIAIAKEMKR